MNVSKKQIKLKWLTKEIDLLSFSFINNPFTFHCKNEKGLFTLAPGCLLSTSKARLVLTLHDSPCLRRPQRHARLHCHRWHRSRQSELHSLYYKHLVQNRQPVSLFFSSPQRHHKQNQHISKDTLTPHDPSGQSPISFLAGYPRHPKQTSSRL